MRMARRQLLQARRDCTIIVQGAQAGKRCKKVRAAESSTPNTPEKASAYMTKKFGGGSIVAQHILAQPSQQPLSSFATSITMKRVRGTQQCGLYAKRKMRRGEIIELNGAWICVPMHTKSEEDNLQRVNQFVRLLPKAASRRYARLWGASIKRGQLPPYTRAGSAQIFNMFILNAWTADVREHGIKRERLVVSLSGATK